MTLRQRADVCIARIDVQKAAADVQCRAQTRQRAVDRRRAARDAGGIGDVVGAVDRRRAIAAELDVLRRDARAGIEQMGATTEADGSGGAGEVAGMGTAIVEIEDAALNIDGAGVVEGDINRRGVAGGAARFAEGTGIGEERIGAGVAAAVIARVDGVRPIAIGDEGGAGTVIDGAGTRDGGAVDVVVQTDVAATPGEDVLVAEGAAAIEEEAIGADGGRPLEDGGAAAAVVAVGDRAGPRDRHRAGAGERAARLSESIDAAGAIELEIVASDGEAIPETGYAADTQQTSGNGQIAAGVERGNCEGVERA